MVHGSGPHGHITAEDVQAAAAAHGCRGRCGVPGEPHRPPGDAGRDDWGPVRRERLPRIRRTIAEQMARSASTIPHVTNFDDADVTELESFRAGVPAAYLGEQSA